MHEKKICFLPQLLHCHCFTQFFSSLSPDMEHLFFLWLVKFVHLCLPKLCLTSYWQVSVLCLQHTGVYIRSGLFGGTTCENNMVDLLIMSGVFFSIHFEWLHCGCVVADACILLVPFVLFPPVEIQQALPSWLNHLALPDNLLGRPTKIVPYMYSFYISLLQWSWSTRTEA